LNVPLKTSVVSATGSVSIYTSVVCIHTAEFSSVPLGQRSMIISEDHNMNCSFLLFASLPVAPFYCLPHFQSLLPAVSLTSSRSFLLSPSLPVAPSYFFSCFQSLFPTFPHVAPSYCLPHFQSFFPAVCLTSSRTFLQFPTFTILLSKIRYHDFHGFHEGYHEALQKLLLLSQ
jgi:hypothetical protein